MEGRNQHYGKPIVLNLNVVVSKFVYLSVLLQFICLAVEVQPTHKLGEQVTQICVIQTLFSLHPLVIGYETSN